MKKLLVVKFGGSVLKDGYSFRSSAQAVKSEVDRGNEVVVVVSAINGDTDELIDLAKNIDGDASREFLDTIIWLGEERSVKLFSSALRLLGVRCVEVLPGSGTWPIITDGNHGDAEPILEVCREKSKAIRSLISEGVVPVVCGYVGMTPEGSYTTLGRGGSDTSAAILANCLEADELVLVKDVGYIYTKDPKCFADAEPFKILTANEAKLLASNGGKVLHHKIFKYGRENLDIRIIPEGGILSEGGTVIVGSLCSAPITTQLVR